MTDQIPEIETSPKPIEQIRRQAIASAAKNLVQLLATKANGDEALDLFSGELPDDTSNNCLRHSVVASMNHDGQRYGLSLLQSLNDILNPVYAAGKPVPVVQIDIGLIPIDRQELKPDTLRAILFNQTRMQNDVGGIGVIFHGEELSRIDGVTIDSANGGLKEERLVGDLLKLAQNGGNIEILQYKSGIDSNLKSSE